MTQSHGENVLDMEIWTLLTMALNFNLKQPRLRIHASAKTVLKWQDQKNKFAVLESLGGKTCTMLEVKKSDNII